MSAGQALKAVATDAAPTKATQNPAVEALNKALSGIGQVLPAHITKERMAKLCLGMMRTNAKLAQAARRNPASFVNSIMHASKLGLEPGIDAHLVPYENKRQGTVEIQCIPDYRGLLKLARNSGDITSVSVQIVYEHDHFELSLGLVETLTHKPKLDGPRGDPVLVYGVARFKDGSHHVEWMSVHDINTIRDGSRGYQNAVRYKSDNPWISSWEEMARKTLVRRMCKYLPRSIELQNAERLIDAGDKGVPAHFEGEFVVVEDPPPEQLQEGSGPDAQTATTASQDAADDAALAAAMERKTDEPQTQQDEPTPADAALNLARTGAYDEARDLARSLPEPDAIAVENAIAEHARKAKRK